MCVLYIYIFSQRYFLYVNLKQQHIINASMSSCKESVTFKTLTQLVYGRHVVMKNCNLNFHENPFGMRRVVPCGRTDGHDEVNSHISQLLCKRTSKRRKFLSSTSQLILAHIRWGAKSIWESLC